MKRFNDKGFGAIEIVLTIVIVAVLGFVGYKAYTVYTAGEDNDGQLTNKQEKEEENETAEETVEDNDEVSKSYVKINKWDVKFPTIAKSSISYKISASNDGVETAALHADAFDSLAKACKDIPATAGTLERWPEDYSNKFAEGELTFIKKINEYKYYYSNSGADCSAKDSSDIQKDVRADVLNTVMNLVQSN